MDHDQGMCVSIQASNKQLETCTLAHTESLVPRGAHATTQYEFVVISPASAGGASTSVLSKKEMIVVNASIMLI